ncbi:hypothetical protein [Nonomuraea sp. LPB2021202275-12-8]|uniref:hypothetical protein n=1 Tax=Nonomuraea sp. LPB2021202275-12-8 TaxID=3120159 RepID=UPI00300D4410
MPACGVGGQLRHALAYGARAWKGTPLTHAALLATGFSGMYAAGGLGYGAAGLAVAWLLDRAGAQAAIGLCALAAAVLALGSSALEVRSTARVPAGYGTGG